MLFNKGLLEPIVRTQASSSTEPGTDAKGRKLKASEKKKKNLIFWGSNHQQFGTTQGAREQIPAVEG